MTGRRWGTVCVAASAVLVLTGCQWSGLNSVSLPGAAGRGEGSFSVVIEMPDVTSISPNSPVMVNDVTVGSISAIETDNWHARVTVALDGSVSLPANATAKIGQTSLLGSKHVALAPPTEVAPEGRLSEGSVIPLASASVYPTTEEALTALSLVLNGGGLAQIHSITTELNTALGGRTDAARDLLSQMDTVTETLDRQREAIVTTMENLDVFAGEITAQRDVLGEALETLDPALAELSAQRVDLTTALDAVGRFGDVGTDLVDRTRDDLKANLSALESTLQKVVETGPDLINNLGNLSTFPFPQTTIDDGMRGDYTNLWALIDLTSNRLQSGLGFGTPFGAPQTPVENGILVDPLTAPLGTGRAAPSDTGRSPQVTPGGPPQVVQGGPTQVAQGGPPRTVDDDSHEVGAKAIDDLRDPGGDRHERSGYLVPESSDHARHRALFGDSRTARRRRPVSERERDLSRRHHRSGQVGASLSGSGTRRIIFGECGSRSLQRARSSGAKRVGNR